MEEEQFHNEEKVYVLDIHHQRQKTSIAGIGHMDSLEAFIYLCMNSVTANGEIVKFHQMEAILSPSILKQIAVQFILLIQE